MSQINAIPVALGGTGANTPEEARANLGISEDGTPGNPPLSIQGANVDGTAFVGIPNSSFDATTGAVTLGASFFVNAPYIDDATFSTQIISQGGIKLADVSSDIGIYIDSAASVSIVNSGVSGLNINDASVPGLLIFELGAGPLNISSVGPGGIILDATGTLVGGGGTGPINLISDG